MEGLRRMDGKYLVSACLAGINCRYDGRNSENKAIAEMVRQGRAIPVCPEMLGGLPAPRPCCEIVRDGDGNRRVVGKDGQDRTREFEEGAGKTLDIAKSEGIRKAVLKSRSPSCGCGIVYDGTFSGRRINGNGITAQMLLDNQIEVLTENDIDMLD